jgi:hypothetical protein
MGVVDWRAWTDQNGGTLPTAPNPPGTPWIENTMFPGVQPISDLINGSTSIPPYANTPVTVNAVDPFGGWTSQQAGPPNYVIRPVIPGLTSP